MNLEEWQEVEKKIKEREKNNEIENCPICLEDFTIEKQVILSCTHVFHEKCLRSFEKHNKI
jgi:hypothetical protein